MPSRSWSWFVALALLGCGETDRPHPEQAEGVGPPAEALPTPDADEGTIEACADRLSRATPDEVRATLDALSYETVFRDACLSARAERQRSPGLCEELSVSSLVERCVERVAIAAGDPMRCPGARAGEGREPRCVALALRDRRLCAGAALLDRAICEAVLVAPDALRQPCQHLPVDLRAACAERARGLAALVGSDRVDGEPLVTSLTLRVGTEPELSLPLAERGARIVSRSCTPTLVVGEAPALLLDRRGSFVLSVPLGGSAPMDVDLSTLSATLEVSLGGATRAAPAERGHVRVTTLERELGGVVEGTFVAELRGAGAPTHVEGAFTTYLRDLETNGPDCPPTP